MAMRAACQTLTVNLTGVGSGPLAPRAGPGRTTASSTARARAAPIDAVFLYMWLLLGPPGRRLIGSNPGTGPEWAGRRRRSGSRPAFPSLPAVAATPGRRG